MQVSRFAAAVTTVGILGLAFLAGTDVRGPLVGLADAVGRAAFWGVVLIACARLAARAIDSKLTGLAHLVWDGASGLALLMALLLAVGVVPGCFHVAVVRGVVAVVIALGAAAMRSDPVPRLRAPGAGEGSSGAIVLFLIALAIAGLAWDRVPPVFFDTRAYHFAFPELWLVTGRVTPFTWSVLSWFPPGMPMLYGVGLATGGEPWANDANLLVGLGLVAMTFDLTRRLFGREAALLAGVLVTSFPLVLYALAIPGADLGHGLFVLGALGSLLVRSDDRPCWLRRAGLLAAGAVLTKYLGLVVPLALGLLWIGVTRLKSEGVRSPRALIGDLLRFAAPATLLFVPWLASNAIVVGNPVAPTASSIFTTRGLAPGWAPVFQGDTHGGLPSWSEVRSLPSRWVTGSEADSRVYPTPAWGWLPLVLVPFAVAAARDDRSLRAVSWLVVILLIIWLLTFRWERFLIAVAALVAIASTGAIAAAARRGPALRLLPVLAGFAAVLSVLPSLIEIGRFNGGIRVALGRESAAEFIEGGLPLARLFHRANDRLRTGPARLLLLGEMRHYGLALPRVAPTGFNAHPLVEALRNAKDAAGVNRELREQGFTHLLVSWGWVVRSASQYPSLADLKDPPESVRAYFSSLGAPIMVEDGVALFEIPD